MTAYMCPCAECTAGRACAARVAPDRAAALQASLRSLVALLDREGGYMTPEDQAALWRARRLVSTGNATLTLTDQRVV